MIGCVCHHTPSEVIGNVLPVIVPPVFENEDPVLGPPKPLACEDGIESHVWRFRIEEGRPTLETDCRLCSDGFWGFAEQTDLSMDEIDVRIEVINESYADDYCVWFDLKPVKLDLTEPVYQQGVVDLHPEGLLPYDATNCTFGVQMSDDGRVWVCINGQTFLRFKPRMEVNHEDNLHPA